MCSTGGRKKLRYCARKVSPREWRVKRCLPVQLLVSLRYVRDNQPGPRTEFTGSNSMKNEPEQLAAEIVNEYSGSGSYSRATLDALARLALSEDLQVAERATRAFFTGLVEPLADSFKAADVTLYNRLFAQVIQICRADPRARALDSELGAFGLTSEEDLIARAEKLRRTTPLYGWRDWANKLRRVIVLS